MFLHSVSPTGDYTSIDVTALPVWRLGLAARAPSADKDVTLVALVFTYPANVPSGVNRIVLATVDTKTPGEAEGITRIGLPYLDLDQNRKRLHEASKSLFNVEAIRKEADVIAAKISQLADLYHGILDALGASKGDNKDLSATIGLPLKGELEGWKFAVTHDRFEQWRGAKNTFKPANAPIIDLSTPVGIAAPAAPSMGAPPPVGSQPPPPPRPPTREERRKAEAKAAPVASPVAPPAPLKSDTPAGVPEDIPAPDGEPPVLTVEDDV